jgi:hypothetical protein
MQNIIALLIVAVAVGYLVRRGWRYFAARKSAAGCGACGSCPTSNGSAAAANGPSENLGTAKPLVTIDLMPSAGRKS